MSTIRNRACSIKRRDPTERIGFYIVLVAACLDLGITIIGINRGWGIEANPFFVWFTEQGTMWMLGAGLFYLVLVAWLYRIAANWLASIMTGMLVASHMLGFLSWVRIEILPELGLLFNEMWFLMTGGILFGSAAAVLSYVDLRTCPDPFYTEQTMVDRCELFDPTTLETLYYDLVLPLATFWVLFVFGELVTLYAAVGAAFTQNKGMLNGPCGGRNKWRRRRGVVYGVLVQGTFAVISLSDVVDLPNFGLLSIPTFGFPIPVIAGIGAGFLLFGWVVVIDR